MLNNNNFQDAIAHHNDIRKEDLKNRIKRIVGFGEKNIPSDRLENIFSQIKREISECLVVEQYIQGVTGDIDNEKLSVDSSKVFVILLEGYRLDKEYTLASERINFLRSIKIPENWIASEESIKDTVAKAIDYYAMPLIIDALAIKGYIPMDNLSNWFIEQLRVIDDYKLKRPDKFLDSTQSHDDQPSAIVSLKRQIKTDKHFGQGNSNLSQIRQKAREESVVGMSGFESAEHLIHCKWALLQHLTHYQRMSLSEANREIHWCITRAKNGESDVLVEKYFDRKLDCSTPEYIDPITNEVSKMLSEFVIYCNYQPDISRGAIVSRVHNKMQDHSYLLKMWNQMQLEISYVLNIQKDGIASRYSHQEIKSAEELMKVSLMDHGQDSLPEWYYLGKQPDLTQSQKELNAQRADLEFRRSRPDRLKPVTDEEVKRFAHETFLMLQAQKINRRFDQENRLQQNSRKPNV